jgi:hypothetical protein
MDLNIFQSRRGRIQTFSKEGANRGTLSRVSFLPPPVRNNIFYEIETSSTGIYNTGLSAQSTGGGRSPFWRKTFKNDGKFPKVYV